MGQEPTGRPGVQTPGDELPDQPGNVVATLVQVDVLPECSPVSCTHVAFVVTPGSPPRRPAPSLGSGVEVGVVRIPHVGPRQGHGVPGDTENPLVLGVAIQTLGYEFQKIGARYAVVFQDDHSIVDTQYTVYGVEQRTSQSQVSAAQAEYGPGPGDPPDELTHGSDCGFVVPILWTVGKHEQGLGLKSFELLQDPSCVDGTIVGDQGDGMFHFGTSLIVWLSL